MGLHLAGRFHLSAIFMPHTFQAVLNTLSTYIFFLQGHHFQKHNLHLKEEIEVTFPLLLLQARAIMHTTNTPRAELAGSSVSQLVISLRLKKS